MSDQYIGEVRPFPYTYAPEGWALCDGTLMSIAENPALYALIGTTYGGDGIQTFALPDLKGRIALHQHQGPGLSLRIIGQVGGSDSVTLTQAQVPSHKHGLQVSNQTGTTNAPVGNVLAKSAHPVYTASTNTLTASVLESQNTGTLPHVNVQPTLTIRYCIALVGIFPSQS